MADEIKYDYETKQAIRGTEGRAIARMQNDGWEPVEQSQGTLRSTLKFRRPKKPVPWLLIGAGAAVLAVLAVVGGITSALSSPGKQKPVRQPVRPPPRTWQQGPENDRRSGFQVRGRQRR
ncbi:hypothetical protein AB0F81_01185 [Actinoplanes sp. NPDC024001]|uniref:hypothetical protein n=1 Tax=Actinoplanes sp. NPDC024001 TaxID=3154598 RepID=UPI0033DF0D86